MKRKLTSKEINDLYQENKKYLLKNPNNPHLLYFFKRKNETISIYKNGTLLIQNTNKYPEKIKLNIVGCDEVGVGDYFGGLFVCCALVKKQDEQILLNYGVKDSKMLNDKEIVKIYNDIKNIVSFRVCGFSPREYNEVISKFNNAHIAKAILHNKCLSEFTNTLKEDFTIVMDQFANEKNYYKYLKIANQNPIRVDVFETKAENKYLAVACASIIARVFFLNQIKELEKKYGITVFLGASNPKIIYSAKQIYKKFGNDGLSDTCKISFRLTEKVKQ